ncbi:ThuA domain-containing protein [Caldicellulosiruptoraceae bacterium PP1]
MKIVTLLGDFYHNHDMMLESLKKALIQKYISAEIIDIKTNDWEKYLNKDTDILVIGTENRINPQDEIINYWMTEEIENKLVDYVKNGGKIFVWHSALASYNENGPYCSMLRGYFKYHPSENKNVYYYFDNSKNTIFTKNEFEFIDEHYFVYCDTENTNVFLLSKSEDGDSIAGWYHNFGKGKVCCLTPAHRIEGLYNEQLINLISEIIEWLQK